jgi:asparaginyl-tRNA synthetase
MPAGIHRRRRIVDLLAEAKLDQSIDVTGWVKTSRFSKNISFVHVFDGSTPSTVQVILDPESAEDLKPKLGVGTAIRVRGHWVASPGAGQAWEVQADEVEIVGSCDPSNYPLQKKRTSLEHLRTLAHLRPRTNTHQAVTRVRNALSWQIHRFFQEHGFLWIHTPILSTSDAEGAGELFAVQSGDTPSSFFGNPVYLTVSGQLQVECFAQSHTDVYTFGPTFRAENSHTARHAAEFWMVEPEMAFADLDDVIALAESFIRQVTQATQDQCADDMAFFSKHIEPGVLEAVRACIDKPFERMTYTEAQDVLARSGRSFEHPIGWGLPLQAEHERFLAEEHVGGPLFVTDYPREQKAFYMRQSDDRRTVAATDLLVPRLGEIIGGSQREERHDVLTEEVTRRGVDPEHLWWYLELRQFGTTPHGGFGLGFERLLMWMTGLQNIRDAIPFPRTPGNAKF